MPELVFTLEERAVKNLAFVRDDITRSFSLKYLIIINQGLNPWKAFGEL